MAFVEIVPNKGLYPNTAILTEMKTASSTTDGFKVKYNGGDPDTVLILENTATSAATATLKAGDGIQGVVDVVINVPASATVCVEVETGRFKHVSGDLKGYVQVVPSATTLKAGACTLL